MAYPSYTVWFRGKPACPCLAEWLPAYEAELQRRGTLTGPLHIYQLIGGADASAGTHTEGGAFDIIDLSSDTDVWVARQMGADATWSRTPPAFMAHIHGVLTGCPHNGPARYQIDEVRAGGDGLVGNTPDPGPRPLSGRTWREGIAWARKQQEDDLPSLDEIADAVWRRVIKVNGEDAKIAAAAMLSQVHNRAGDTEAKVGRVIDALAKLEDEVVDDATKRQVRKVRDLIEGA